MEVFRFTLAIALGILLPLAAQIWDRRRLTDAQRARAWNTASWGSALYGFGPLSMLGWCWVTRNEWERWRRQSLWVLIGRSLALLVLGALVALLPAAVIVGVDTLIGLALGESP